MSENSNELLINEPSKQWILMGIVAISIFMYSLDYSMLNISLPTISNYFNVSVGVVALLPLAYLLVVTSTILGFGKLGDIKGFSKLFMIGMGIFVVGTFLCSLAPSLNILLLIRVFQCLGEAMYSAAGIALLTTFLPSNIKGRALGIVATSQGLGLSLGPAIGGMLNTYFSWHTIFLVNIPIGVVTLMLALKFLPRKQLEARDKSFDVPGSILLFVLLSALILTLNYAGRLGWSDPFIIGSIITFVTALVAFIVRETRAKSPLLDLELFKNKNFSFANISAFLMVCGCFGFSFLFPFYLQLVRGIDVSMSGFLMMIPSILMMVLGPITGNLSDKIGSKGLSVAATILMIASFGMLTVLSPTASLLYIAACLFVLGCAMGFFLAP
ncbi:MAG: MFS transporter, partial [Candidatus Margulisiibacteriota bacterium]